MRLVFFDLETGGLDPAKHPIIQIAAIAVDEKLQELAEFEAKILFKVENADPQALAINSYNAQEWAAKARLPGDVCDDLSSFFKRFADVKMTSKAGKPYQVAQLIGHNAASFDGPFLQQWYRKLDQFMPAAFSVLCTYQKAMHFFHDRYQQPRPENFKLESLCKYFNVPLANAHDALADVRATLGLYRALRKAEFEIPPEMIDFNVPEMMTEREPEHDGAHAALG